VRRGKTKVEKVDAVEALKWQLKRMAHWIPWPVPEYRFHPTREYRLDLCWPSVGIKVGVEIDGGIWRTGGGAHTGTGHIRDIRKGNAAILLGYRVLHFVPEDIVTSSGRTIPTALDDIVELFRTLGYKETR